MSSMERKPMPNMRSGRRRRCIVRDVRLGSGSLFMSEPLMRERISRMYSSITLACWRVYSGGQTRAKWVKRNWCERWSSVKMAA
jgi:hypothetical protein